MKRSTDFEVTINYSVSGMNKTTTTPAPLDPEFLRIPAERRTLRRRPSFFAQVGFGSRKLPAAPNIAAQRRQSEKPTSKRWVHADGLKLQEEQHVVAVTEAVVITDATDEIHLP